MRVGLFVTCIVDLFRPQVGFAALKLLRDAGCEVVIPEAQSCCGQPAWNSGDRPRAQALARQVIQTFEALPHLVVPSGSCGGMISHHYVDLFGDQPEWQARARALGARTFELTQFLSDVLKIQALPGARFPAHVTYHDSCSGLRELGIRHQPRRLLAMVEGVQVTELADGEVCCGFGGTFCVKYPDISNRMVEGKVAQIQATGAETVLAGDMGCLLNIAGKLARGGTPVAARHVAEVLAGMTDTPAIGVAPARSVRPAPARAGPVGSA